MKQTKQSTLRIVRIENVVYSLRIFIREIEIDTSA